MKSDDLIFLLFTDPPELPDIIRRGNLWSAFINNGNFAFNRSEYLQVHQKYLLILHLVPESFGSDGWHFYVLWLKMGNCLKVVKNMNYIHTIRDNAWSNSYIEEKMQVGEILLKILTDESILIH